MYIYQAFEALRRR